MPSIFAEPDSVRPHDRRAALSAVFEPGGELVSEEVARAIVRFVAGRRRTRQRRGRRAPVAHPRTRRCAHCAGPARRSPPDLLAGSRTPSSPNSTSARWPTSRGVGQFIEDDL